MKRALLDVNVLVAVAWPNHVHHAPARRWFAGEAAGGWASCAITQLGFVRVSCNPLIVGEAVSAPEAQKLLDRLTQVGDHAFWGTLPPLHALDRRLVDSVAGHREVTDAYLLGLVLQNDARLVTLDRGLVELARAVPEAEAATVLIAP